MRLLEMDPALMDEVTLTPEEKAAVIEGKAEDASARKGETN